MPDNLSIQTVEVTRSTKTGSTFKASYIAADGTTIIVHCDVRGKCPELTPTTVVELTCDDENVWAATTINHCPDLATTFANLRDSFRRQFGLDLSAGNNIRLQDFKEPVLDMACLVPSAAILHQFIVSVEDSPALTRVTCSTQKAPNEDDNCLSSLVIEACSNLETIDSVPRHISDISLTDVSASFKLTGDAAKRFECTSSGYERNRLSAEYTLAE